MDTTTQDQTQETAVPRRIDMGRWTGAERAIYDAMQAVEGMPADERLTRAVVLLHQAQEAVADYVDGVEPPAQDQTQGVRERVRPIALDAVGMLLDRGWVGPDTDPADDLSDGADAIVDAIVDAIGDVRKPEAYDANMEALEAALDGDTMYAQSPAELVWRLANRPVPADDGGVRESEHISVERCEALLSHYDGSTHHLDALLASLATEVLRLRCPTPAPHRGGHERREQRLEAALRRLVEAEAHCEYLESADEVGTVPCPGIATDGAPCPWCDAAAALAPVPADDGGVREQVAEIVADAIRDTAVRWTEAAARHAQAEMLAFSYADRIVALLYPARIPNDASRPVHNHGPEDGPGLTCRESLIGDCLRPSGGREGLCERCHVTPTEQRVYLCESCLPVCQDEWYPPTESTPATGEREEGASGTSALMKQLADALRKEKHVPEGRGVCALCNVLSALTDPLVASRLSACVATGELEEGERQTREAVLARIREACRCDDYYRRIGREDPQCQAHVIEDYVEQVFATPATGERKP